MVHADEMTAKITCLGMQPPVSDMILSVLRVPVVQVYVVIVVCYPKRYNPVSNE